MSSNPSPATAADRRTAVDNRAVAEDAGAAPTSVSTQDTGHDGGEPPAWLFDAISGAGGGSVKPDRSGPTDGVPVFDAGVGRSA
jgi:hypothetical protein